MVARVVSKVAEVSASQGKVQLIKEWLKENYDIKVNIFDRSKTYIVSKVREYSNSISENDIYIHMIDEGVTCSKSLLKTIMTSPNQITSYNPVLDYLDGVKGKWKGESMIDYLCSCVHAHDFRDRKDGEYQRRLKYLIKKWLVAAVACAYGKRQNDVAIGFVNAQGGIGKTSLVETMVPPELEDYYIVSSKEERLFRMTDCFANRFVINFDEFVGITKSTETTFKNCMSRQSIEVKYPGESFVSSAQRIASCAFTSNKTQEQGGFIFVNDSGLLRRLATIEIDDIDDYRTDFDVDQLWAEAMVLYEGDFDYVWNRDDYADFNQYNSRYIIETTAYKLIKEWYRVPEEDEECEFKMPQEIVRDLRAAKKITSSMNRVDEITVGQALRQLGYERTAKKLPTLGTRYGYRVVRLY